MAEAPRDIDILLMEGTNLGREDLTLTEYQLEEKMTWQLNQTQGPAFLHCSAQNIDRMVTAYRAALKSQRILVVASQPYRFPVETTGTSGYSIPKGWRNAWRIVETKSSCIGLIPIGYQDQIW